MPSTKSSRLVADVGEPWVGGIEKDVFVHLQEVSVDLLSLGELLKLVDYRMLSRPCRVLEPFLCLRLSNASFLCLVRALFIGFEFFDGSLLHVIRDFLIGVVDFILNLFLNVLIMFRKYLIYKFLVLDKACVFRVQMVKKLS